MKEEDRAWARALKEYKAPGFRTAYMRGARAAMAGRSADSNPYRHDPKKTWRAVYRAAWLKGFWSVKEG